MGAAYNFILKILELSPRKSLVFLGRMLAVHVLCNVYSDSCRPHGCLQLEYCYFQETSSKIPEFTRIAAIATYCHMLRFRRMTSRRPHEDKKKGKRDETANGAK